MRLYVVELTPEAEQALGTADSPFPCHVGVTWRVVVRAADEEQARAAAREQAGTEAAEVWLDPRWTRCRELTPRGEAGVVCVEQESW